MEQLAFIAELSVPAGPARLQDGLLRLLPPRSTAGQLTLDQHIGVRIPGGQPK
jgi:hypothetical protein